MLFESAARTRRAEIVELEKRLRRMRRELTRMEQDEAVRRPALERALAALRDAGPEGCALADGDGVVIPSGQFPQLLYAVVPIAESGIGVYHRLLGRLGSICIQSADDAPGPDIVLTRLRLCQGDERRLWTVGRYSPDDQFEYLPKQVRDWISEQHHRDAETNGDPAEVPYEVITNAARRLGHLRGGMIFGRRPDAT